MTQDEINIRNSYIGGYIGIHHKIKWGYGLWAYPDYLEDYFENSETEITVGDFHFHDSWYWLMPVVEKIITDNESCCIFGAKKYMNSGNNPPYNYFSMLDDCKTGVQAESVFSFIEACFISVSNYCKQLSEL